jgi:hypothetical protein
MEKWNFMPGVNMYRTRNSLHIVCTFVVGFLLKTSGLWIMADFFPKKLSRKLARKTVHKLCIKIIIALPYKNIVC